MATVEHLVPLASRPDEELMRRWVEGRAKGDPNHAVYETLYHRHGAAVRGRIAQVLGRHARHVDDVFQETWLEVAQVAQWKPGSFRSWLLTVATRKALDRLALRDNWTEMASSVGPRHGDADGQLGEPRHPSPAGRVTARELLGNVAEILADITEEQRDAWVLRYVEGLSFEELAARLELPLGTAKTRVRLAKEALAAGLAARGLDARDLEAASELP